MNNSLLVIIFSYNRAMQLDCLLRTTINRLKFKDYNIKVLFDTTGDHKEGYEVIKEKYKNNSKIQFVKIEPYNDFWTDKLPFLFRNRNLWRYIKYKYLRMPLDNFKRSTETIIKNSKSEFCMFLTDDGYFYKDVLIPDHIFDKIRKDPYQVSYRMYVGKNLSNCPEDLELQSNVLKWNYYNSNMKSHWAYPFSVDVSIYHTLTLYKIIHPVFYHMPTTLESFVVTHCRTRKLLGVGFSPIESNYLGFVINRVAKVGNNFAGIIDTDMLNHKFIEGYTLEYEFPIPPKVQGLIPSKIFLNHKVNKQITIES